MTLTCQVCSTEFEAKRRDTKFCGATCRSRAHRAPKGKARHHPEASFETATRRELERLGKADTMLGQQIITIAARMSHGAETGAALASLSREHSRLMGALTGTADQGDALDELKERRNAKSRAATGSA